MNILNSRIILKETIRFLRGKKMKEGKPGCWVEKIPIREGLHTIQYWCSHCTELKGCIGSGDS